MTIERTAFIRRLRAVAIIAAGAVPVAGCEPGSRTAPAAEPADRAAATAPADLDTAPRGDTVPRQRTVDAAALVDTLIPAAVAGEDGWGYHLSSTADLDGDGESERVVITARVEMMRGRPAWDDGQPWQVYVEEPNGARTYVYAQRLQLGSLLMRVALAGESSPPTIVLLEHLPDRMRLFEVTYGGPSDASAIEILNRRLDPTGELASPSLP